MTNKYLEKIAKDHMLKAYLSPAWQENAIAKEHGKEGLKGAVRNVGKHFGGGFRAKGRAALEGITGAGVGAALGVGVGVLSKGKINPQNAASIAGGAGNMVGVLHGGYKSYKNQAAEAHKKYAYLETLIDKGLDFDVAVKLVFDQK